MKVLHIISSLAGGPGRILVNLVLNAPKDVKNSIFVINESDQELELYTSLISKGSEITFSSRVWKLDKSVFIEIWKSKKIFSPDVIVSYDFSSNVLGATSVIGSQVRWFPCVRGLETAFQLWRACVLRIIFLRANKVIVPSSAVKEKLYKHKITSFKNISIIPNGIEINSKSRNNQAPINIYNLVCVGNFYSDVKGQQYAVEALKKLPRTYNLTFIGQGKELENIKMFVKQYKLSKRVKFVGGLTNKIMRNTLVDYDLLLVPSISESFGIAAIEGMAAGLPVIASDVGGLSEVINDECGVLVPVASPSALVNGIRNVCENSTIWKNMHWGGMKRVKENYSVTKMVDRYYEAFANDLQGVEDV